jgi:hypothetical protein
LLFLDQISLRVSPVGNRVALFHHTGAEGNVIHRADRDETAVAVALVALARDRSTPYEVCQHEGRIMPTPVIISFAARQLTMGSIISFKAGLTDLPIQGSFGRKSIVPSFCRNLTETILQM